MMHIEPDLSNAGEVADHLERAADYLRVNGHCKHEMLGPVKDGLGRSACAIGAIRQTSAENAWGGGHTGIQAVIQLGIRLWERNIGVRPDTVYYNAASTGVAHWNDRSSTKPEQVVDLMLEVAKDLRNGEVS